MIELKLTLRKGQPLHLFLSASFAVTSVVYKHLGEDHVGTQISDGVHNNGGWIVREQLPAVLAQIRGESS